MAGTHSVDGHSCCHGHFFLMAIFSIPFSEWVSKSQSTSSLSNVVWMFPLSIYRDIHIISVLCAYWAPSISLIQSKSNYLLFFFDCDFMIVCFNKLHIIISSFGFRVYAVWAISCMALSLRSSRIICSINSFSSEVENLEYPLYTSARRWVDEMKPSFCPTTT